MAFEDLYRMQAWLMSQQRPIIQR